MSSSGPSPGAGGGSKFVTIRLAADNLFTSPRQVCRYAGGTRYRPDAARQALVQTAIASAGKLIKPALIYAVHPVDTRFADGRLTLHNGLAVQLPLNESDLDIGYVAAIVCTLGSELEETCRHLNRQG